METYQLFTILISILAIVISTVSLVRTRKVTEKQLELEEQQASLAKKQLEQIEAQEEISQLANIDVELQGDGTSWELSITNYGEAEAQNVNISWVGEHPRFLDQEINNKLPIKRFPSGKERCLKIARSMACLPSYEGVIHWVNPNGESVSQEFEIHY